MMTRCGYQAAEGLEAEEAAGAALDRALDAALDAFPSDRLFYIKIRN